jgi:hypothetical protein
VHIALGFPKAVTVLKTLSSGDLRIAACFLGQPTETHPNARLLH